MNLDKLFLMQKELGKVGLFNYQGEDRFEKLILALLVELGECANCWRGFKFWSTNQEPKTKELRNAAMMEEDKVYYNPLLEEYVDGLHFLVELALFLGVPAEAIEEFIQNTIKAIGSITNQFGYLYNRTSELMDLGSLEDKQYKMLHIFNAYLGLGYRLGFTWEEIEQAYQMKHEINIQRQKDGY